MSLDQFDKASPFFIPIDMSAVYNYRTDGFPVKECSKELREFRDIIPAGDHVLYGVPFQFGEKKDIGNNILFVRGKSTFFRLRKPIQGLNYLIFAHGADVKKSVPGEDGIIRPMMGHVRLGEAVAIYRLHYEDGSCCGVEIKRRFNINDIQYIWGEGAYEAVLFEKPRAYVTNTDNLILGRIPKAPWGISQTRVPDYKSGRFALWLYAMENPCPDKKIIAMEFEPQSGSVLISGITGCTLKSNPLRWEYRKKTVVSFPPEMGIGENSDYDHIKIDIGQVISVQPQLNYENQSWENGYNNKQPALVENSAIIEYTAHPSAGMYLGWNGEIVVPVSELSKKEHVINGYKFQHIGEATKSVVLRIVERGTNCPVPAKIHVHGAVGEYLPPINRHRNPNPYWFEDYSVDFVHGRHCCTYIDGEAEFRLPLSEVFVEVSKGFEITPIRKRFTIDSDTDEISVELDHVLKWRENGWISADTHVHFVSPGSAMLEGEAEGVNVVNLLVSQWGELFTNLGDFDGRTVLESPKDRTAECLVRVGTEHRQSILGHISLLGYEGRMILPLTTGGPEESALGDAVEETLTHWAERCKKQNGLVILPHFPEPRTEGAAVIVSGMADGVETTSRSDLYGGIDPFFLSDWYRYLNCGYHIPLAGGTDKMSACTAIGTVRTYSKIGDEPLTYERWKESMRKGCTFITYGPLLEFRVEGKEAGERIEITSVGKALRVDWVVASVTLPVTRVELVMNGRTREIYRTDPFLGRQSGGWTVEVTDNCWIALRVRGHQPDKKEIIAAHSSTVMVNKAGESCFNLRDAGTILEQIDGAITYIKTIGTKAEERIQQRLLGTLQSAYRTLQNRIVRHEV